MGKSRNELFKSKSELLQFYLSYEFLNFSFVSFSHFVFNLSFNEAHMQKKTIQWYALEWEINKKVIEKWSCDSSKLLGQLKGSCHVKTKTSIIRGEGRWKKWEDILISTVQSHMNDSKFTAEDT